MNFILFFGYCDIAQKVRERNSMWNGVNKNWVVLELGLVGSNKRPELRHMGQI